jgi:hypothetical protein
MRHAGPVSVPRQEFATFRRTSLRQRLARWREEAHDLPSPPDISPVRPPRQPAEQDARARTHSYEVVTSTELKLPLLTNAGTRPNDSAPTDVASRTPHISPSRPANGTPKRRCLARLSDLRSRSALELSAPQPLPSVAQYPYRDPSVPSRTLRDECSTADTTLPMPEETTSSRGPTASPASHIPSRPCDAALQSRTTGNGNRGWRFITFALATLAASPVMARLVDTDTHLVPTAIATCTAVAWPLLRGMLQGKRQRSARGSESVKRAAADVHVTRCAADVASLESSTHTHVIRVACTTATWRSHAPAPRLAWV